MTCSLRLLHVLVLITYFSKDHSGKYPNHKHLALIRAFFLYYHHSVSSIQNTFKCIQNANQLAWFLSMNILAVKVVNEWWKIAIKTLLQVNWHLHTFVEISSARLIYTVVYKWLFGNFHLSFFLWSLTQLHSICYLCVWRRMEEGRPRYLWCDVTELLNILLKRFHINCHIIQVGFKPFQA